MFSKVRSPQLLARITTWLVAAIASLAPLSSALAADGITPEILAAAKTEGQVTYYTSADLVLANKLKAAFEAKYPIKVNVLRQSSSTIFNRVNQEFDLGTNAADTVETSVMSHFVDMKAKKMLMPFTPATANLIRSPKLYDPEHYWHAVKLELTSMNYNTDKLKGNDVPRTWKDLLDPKYKGQSGSGTHQVERRYGVDRLQPGEDVRLGIFRGAPQERCADPAGVHPGRARGSR